MRSHQFLCSLLVGLLLVTTGNVLQSQNADMVGKKLAEQTAETLSQNLATETAKIFTEEAIFYRGDGSERHGRTAITANHPEYFEKWKMLISFQPTENMLIGDNYLYQYGRLQGNSMNRVNRMSFDLNGEYVHLYKRSETGWKLHRVVGFQRDSMPRTIHKAGMYPVKDKQALATANEVVSRIAFAWSKADWAGYAEILHPETQALVQSGEKRETLDDEKSNFQMGNSKYKYAIAGNVVDAIQLADDWIYAMGHWSGNVRAKNTAAQGIIPAGEFIVLLNKKDDKWKRYRFIQMQRGESQVAEDIAKAQALQYLVAFNDQNTDELLGMMANSAIEMPADGQVYQGMKAIEKAYSEFFRVMDAKNIVAVKDAVFLSDNAIFSMGNYKIEGKTKKDNAPITETGDYAVLMVKKGNDWKVKRLVGMRPNTVTDKLLSRSVPNLPVGDQKAFDIAAEIINDVAFRYTNGSYTASNLLPDALHFGGGEYKTKADLTDEFYKKTFAATEVSLAARPLEAFFVADDMIYACGTWQGNVRDKQTGAYQALPPGEYIQILKNENGKWRVYRSATYHRGTLAPADALASGGGK